MIETTGEALHASDMELLGRRIMQVTLERTGARHGAILLWDESKQGLAIDFHVVEDLIVTIPDEVIPLRRGARFNGVAAYAYATNQPYVCHHAPSDPHYRPYYFDVVSVAATPIRYQDRAIGVLSVSSRREHVFGEETLEALAEVASSSAMFLRRAQLYRQSLTGGTGRPFLIKGLSPEWLEVERRIERVASTNAPVLVCGESGTGKELVAHAIHFNSRRASAPFVTVNCAAIPDTLLESELFGHVRGAFTGASAERRGEFQKAHRGTLFLDELGELPMPLQAKVLRAVEDGEIQPLGSNEPPTKVDVRLVCATNRDLPAMIQGGTFRDDLYFRLSVMTMDLPPLRSYKHDNLPVMAQVFLKQAAERHQRGVRRITDEAMALLLEHDYPGNVRELKNVIEHAVIMAAGEALGPSDLPRAIVAATPETRNTTSRGDDLRTPSPSPSPSRSPQRTLAELREQWLTSQEGPYLARLLDECAGNVRAAAERAGVNHVTMYRLLDKYGMGRARGKRGAVGLVGAPDSSDTHPRAAGS